MKLGAICVGAALGGGELAYFCLMPNGFWGGIAVEKSFDVASLHDIKAHGVCLLDQAGKHAVLITSIRGHDEVSLLGFVLKQRSQG